MRWIWLVAAIGCGGLDDGRHGGPGTVVVATDTIAGIGKPCVSDAECITLLSCVPVDGGSLCALRADPCPPGTKDWQTTEHLCTATCWEVCMKGCSTPAGLGCNYSRPCFTGAAPDAGLVIGVCH